MGEKGKITYQAEGGGYTVLCDGVFVGRVKRIRSAYEHSNGRTYRGWSWAAWPVHGRGLYENRTRTKAVAHIIAGTLS